MSHSGSTTASVFRAGAGKDLYRVPEPLLPTGTQVSVGNRDSSTQRVAGLAYQKSGNTDSKNKMAADIYTMCMRRL